MTTETPPPRLVPDRPSDECPRCEGEYSESCPRCSRGPDEVGAMDLSAPERVWLQIDVDGDNEDRSEVIPRENWTELTWHYAPIGGQEVEYIRKDLAAAPPAEAPAERGAWERMAKRLDDAREVEEETSGLQDTIDAMRTAAELIRAAAPAGAVALNAEYTRGRNDGWEAAKAAPAAPAEVTGLREGNWHHPDGGRIVGWVIEPDDVARMKADAFCLPREVAEALETLRSAPRVTGGREDSELLDFMQNERVALIPEFEGGWDVEVFHDDGNVTCIGSGHTPRAALIAAIQAANGGEG